MDFTLIIPVHNEEAVLERNALALYGCLEALKDVKRFELVLACNGCTDSSEEISRALSKRLPGVTHISIEGRGLGTAIKEAALKAKYPMVMFYAIDLPFGLDIIGRSIEASVKNCGAVVVGSKGHRESVVKRGIARSAFSGTISVLNNLLFGLGVKDTQGSILFYSGVVKKYSAMMDSPGAFFQTQILIYSKISGYAIVEIPVVLAREMRKTRFRLAGDGLKYVRALFAEKGKLSRARRKQAGC